MRKLTLVTDTHVWSTESAKIRSLRKKLFVFGTLVMMKSVIIEKFQVRTFVEHTRVLSRDVPSQKKDVRNQKITSVRKKVAKTCFRKEQVSVQNTSARLRTVTNSDIRSMSTQNFVPGTSARNSVVLPDQSKKVCVRSVLGCAISLLTTGSRESGSSVRVPFSSNVVASNTIVLSVTLL